MEQIMLHLQGKKCWKSFLKAQCRKNKIRPQLVAAFTLLKFRKTFEKFSNIVEASKLRTKSSVWLENELKAYQWFLLAYTGCRGLLIEQCTQREWSELSTIFCKDESTMEYEALKLAKQRALARRPWEGAEIVLLQQIIRQEGGNKWNEMARRLFAISGGRFFRSGKQCRQRWFNHLDPHKKHGHWNSTEDRKIAEHILKRGNRWSEIAKALGKSRTEHMVKNRLKTMLIRLRKRYGEEATDEELLVRFTHEEQFWDQSLYSSQEMGKESLDVQGVPVQTDPSQERMVLSNEQQDQYIGGDFDSFLPTTPNNNVLIPAVTPNWLHTPHSLTFLMNYSFDRFEREDLFLANS